MTATNTLETRHLACDVLYESKYILQLCAVTGGGVYVTGHRNEKTKITIVQKVNNNDIKGKSYYTCISIKYVYYMLYL